MTDLFLLSGAQMDGSWAVFRFACDPRVDGRRIVSVLVLVIKNGVHWRDAPKEYGAHKTVYNRFVRWSRGAFQRDPR